MPKLSNVYFDLTTYIICDVLKHTDGYQVVVDAVSSVSGVQVYCVEDGPEVFYWQHRDVVADDQFETLEPLLSHLVLLLLDRLADRQDDDPPSIILDLVPTLLDDLLHELQDQYFVLAMAYLQQLTKRQQNSRLPLVTDPLLICLPILLAKVQINSFTLISLYEPTALVLPVLKHFKHQ